jgi:hypothetical protein
MPVSVREEAGVVVMILGITTLTLAVGSNEEEKMLVVGVEEEAWMGEALILGETSED